MAKKNALIMAGGTGGHVIPAIEIAKGLRSQGYDIIWLGTKKGIEYKLVPKNNFKLFYLPIWGVRGKGVIHKLFAPFKVFISIMYSIYICLKYRPKFVLGMGGFASGPGGIAAWLFGIPLIIHEQNAVFCLTNRILGKLSTKILTSFPTTDSDKQYMIPANNYYYTGNPVRAEILSLIEPKQRWQQRVGALRVLILGGSRGAVILNNTVPKSLAQLPVSQRPEVWHQCGAGHYDMTKESYEQQGLKARIDTFIDNISEAYAWADLVIARAGALTVSELAAAGLPSILIPYPHATDDHQKKNAMYLVQHDAAVMIDQKYLDYQTLAETLLDLINSKPKLLEMAESAKQLCKKDATTKIIEYCQEAIK